MLLFNTFECRRRRVSPAIVVNCSWFSCSVEKDFCFFSWLRRQRRRRLQQRRQLQLQLFYYITWRMPLNLCAAICDRHLPFAYCVCNMHSLYRMDMNMAWISVIVLMLDDLSPAHSPLFPQLDFRLGRRMGHMLMSPLRENNYRSLFCLQSEVYSL